MTQSYKFEFFWNFIFKSVLLIQYFWRNIAKTHAQVKKIWVANDILGITRPVNFRTYLALKDLQSLTTIIGSIVKFAAALEKWYHF